MGMRKHKPVPLKLIEKARYKGHHTICQFLRDIYALTEDEEIKLKARVAMSMAKSMHEKLKKRRKEAIKNNAIIEELENKLKE